ncbi:MAG: nucleotidyltransferase family protein, partial [Campylobacterales bacterium]|nr:nucleotidyltransferase family protein [Campylobacterales bacterium]
IDGGAIQIALIVDENDKLLGTLTDGDIRRGLLNGFDLNSSIESIFFKTPTIAKISDTKEEILNLALSKKLHQIPIIDEHGKIVGIQEIEELIKPKGKTNKVILMVGGLGTRLRPLTENTPKPMLKVGNKPILQTIVEKFAEYGYTNIVMCVNYKSHIIQDYFGDGSSFGVNIEYILEEKRMGTAGALSLLREKPTEPFFVMNGDLLTNINFEHMMDYHLQNNSIATMGVREYDFQVPYGVVNIDGIDITSIEEKPVHKFFVSGGVYVLSPEVLEYIPNDEFFDMPTLFEKVITDKKKSISFPIREYWMDIGRMEEFEKANNEYHEVFNV